VTAGRLSILEFIDSDAPPPDLPTARGRIAGRLAAYFRGDLDALDSIEVEPSGTPFQLRVWEALRRIPVGETRSYLAIAIELGAPTATRAVGAANGRNPVAVVLPCHRVIASSGALQGYGGGLWRKEWLLRHERALPPGLFDRTGAPPG
jgi:methylated-DNA-[protein]-cysteine S-methyltransferase